MKCPLWCHSNRLRRGLKCVVFVSRSTRREWQNHFGATLLLVRGRHVSSVALNKKALGSDWEGAPNYGMCFTSLSVLTDTWLILSDMRNAVINPHCASRTLLTPVARCICACDHGVGRRHLECSPFRCSEDDTSWRMLVRLRIALNILRRRI